jgi:hypothetical protein
VRDEKEHAVVRRELELRHPPLAVLSLRWRRLACGLCPAQGYKNWQNFPKFDENRWNRAGLNLKIAKYCSPFQNFKKG